MGSALAMSFPTTELTSARYSANLEDESGAVVAGGVLDTCLLSLYEETTSAIINSRNKQNVLNLNGVSFTTPINILQITPGGPGTGFTVTITTNGPHLLTNLDITGQRQQVWLVVSDVFPAIAKKVVISVVDAVTLTAPLLTLSMGGLVGSILKLPNMIWALSPADNTIVLDSKPIENHIALFEATWGSGTKALRHEVLLTVANLAMVS